jgi:hypothetical protein
MRLGITPRRCSANSLGGTHSRHCGGLCDMASISSVALSAHSRTANGSRPRRGPTTPSNHFLVNLQGQIMTLGRRDAIPATVGPVRPPPCLRHHAGHCYNNSIAVGRTGTGCRHACHCIPYGSPSTASSSPSEDAMVNHYALTLEVATVRVQDTP